jgi:hypothetical protein
MMLPFTSPLDIYNLAPIDDSLITLRPNFNLIDRYFDERFRHLEQEFNHARHKWLDEWKKDKGDVAVKDNYYTSSS